MTGHDMKSPSFAILKGTQDNLSRLSVEQLA